MSNGSVVDGDASRGITSSVRWRKAKGTTWHLGAGLLFLLQKRRLAIFWLLALEPEYDPRA